MIAAQILAQPEWLQPLARDWQQQLPVMQQATAQSLAAWRDAGKPGNPAEAGDIAGRLYASISAGCHA